MKAAAVALLLLAGGCASFDGSNLQPGRSSASDVRKLMGEPALQRTRPDGDTVWYFSRLPFGRAIFAATLAPDGVLKGVEPTLTRDNMARVRISETTREQVLELFGPPYRSARAAFKPLDVWEYPWLDIVDKRVLWISFSDDGVVREVIEMHDFRTDPPSPPSRR